VEIKHFTGKELQDFFGDEPISSKLGFFTLEYFFSIYEERNYILLFKENKIIGQITYLKKRNELLLLTISITKNEQYNGYSKLLLNEYLKVLKNRTFNITPFSEEGEKSLYYFFVNREINIIEEKDF